MLLHTGNPGMPSHSYLEHSTRFGEAQAGRIQLTIDHSKQSLGRSTVVFGTILTDILIVPMPNIRFGGHS